MKSWFGRIPFEKWTIRISIIEENWKKKVAANCKPMLQAIYHLERVNRLGFEADALFLETFFRWKKAVLFFLGKT